MRHLFAVAAVAVLLPAGAAFAQQAQNTMQPSPPVQPTPPAQADATSVPGAPPPPPGPSTGPAGNDWRADWRRGHRPPPPPPSKAAHFRIEDGSMKIDVKCADDEPMKACADEVNQILDRLAGSSSRRESSRDDYDDR